MQLRVVVALAVVGLAGCAEEEWPIRPPGGGGGGTGDGGGVDTGGVDAAGIAGRICIVTDLLAPGTCPQASEQAGVQVQLATTTQVATSGTNGLWSIDTTLTDVTLYVGDTSLTLARSTVDVASTSGVIDTPIATQSHWDAVVASLGVSIPDTSGSIVVYVDDAGSPATNVTFQMVSGSSVAPFYDNGGALMWSQSGGTGAAGVALLPDVPPGTYALTGSNGSRNVSVTGVVVRADALTFVQATLP